MKCFTGIYSRQHRLGIDLLSQSRLISSLYLHFIKSIFTATPALFSFNDEKGISIHIARFTVPSYDPEADART